MNKEKLIPKIRFYGFITVWEQRKFHEIGTLNRGKSKHRPRNDVRLYNGEFPFIQTGDVAKAGLFLIKYSQTYSDFGIQQSKFWDKGTLLITIAANIAETSILGIKAAFPDSIIGFNSNKVDMVFIKNIIDNASNTLRRKAETSSQANLNLAKLSDLNISLPTLEEQIKIGDFFKQLDNAMILQQQLLNDHKQLKKAMLQKMFPQKGEIVPRVRVDGFSGDWNEHKFGDVFCRKSNKGRSDLPYVTVTERETIIRNDGAHGFGSNKSDESKLNAKIILNGEFLIDLSSYGRGIYMCGMDGITSSAYHVLELLSGDCGYWSEYFITHNFIESLKRLTPPGVRQGKMVEVSELLETYTLIPSISEQQKIGHFFKKLDKTIELHQKKLETYQELKKAMLQKMFV